MRFDYNRRAEGRGLVLQHPFSAMRSVYWKPSRRASRDGMKSAYRWIFHRFPPGLLFGVLYGMLFTNRRGGATRVFSGALLVFF
jgi:hypothetical protein